MPTTEPRLITTSTRATQPLRWTAIALLAASYLALASAETRWIVLHESIVPIEVDHHVVAIIVSAVPFIVGLQALAFRGRGLGWGLLASGLGSLVLVAFASYD